jgi:cyclopropane fatty-acyl-phospholipid synthase-like methyltransferase
MGIQNVSEFYDRVTDQVVRSYGPDIHYGYWSDPTRPLPLPVATAAMTDQVISRLALRPGSRVLDVGCGTGAPAIRLAKQADVHVVGITTSRRQVEMANASASAATVSDRVRFAHADALDLPHGDRAFDAAFALEATVHFADRARFLREAVRVLRPGGTLVIAEPALRRAPADDAERAALDRFGVNFHASLARIDDYPRLLGDAGLRLHDLADVSDHVRPGYLAAATAMNSLRAEFAAVMGEAEFDSFIGSLRGFAQYCGYVIVTAERPAT